MNTPIIILIVTILQKLEFYYGKKFNSRMKETFSCIPKSFPAYNGFIVGFWSSIVQTSQFENKKNPETG